MEFIQKNFGTEMNVKNIFNAFDHGNTYVKHSELNSGHINDTFIVDTASGRKYILQRINHHIFKDVVGLVNNKVLISNHIRKQFSNLSEEEFGKTHLTFIKAKNSEVYYHKQQENFWNMMAFIEGGITYEIVKNETIAYEGGKLLGDFLNQTADFDSSELINVIPNFHDMSFRFKQHASSIQSASKDKLKKAAKLIDMVSDLKEEMFILQHLKDAGELPIRVTHNDAKISNALFDTNHKGICMIDTDTVMQGIIHYDFGDAIRTICNTAAEDEKDLSKVDFNLDYYHTYTKGFLETAGNSLTSIEKKYLTLGAKSMVFIIALRFLTDYLNNDCYYKIKYPEHNLDRAKNQFRLLECLTEKVQISYCSCFRTITN